jgi:hypothetical protein
MVSDQTATRGLQDRERLRGSDTKQTGTERNRDTETEMKTKGDRRERQ